MVQESTAQSGPPYLPDIALAGGRPTVDVDVPILAVLLCFYIGGAIGNMFILQRNRRNGHKFLMSGAMFGFCMSRIATCVLRIAWATRPTNASLAIAAMIFLNVGILIVYILTQILALRLFRATHPTLGWNRVLGAAFKVSYVLLFVAIVLVISFTVLSFYTLDTRLRSDAIWIQRASILYLLLFSLTPTMLLVASLVIPAPPESDHFGTASVVSKYVVLGVTVFFSNFDAGFRTGTNWAPGRPATDPAWYQSKPAFYVILFGLEIAIIYWLLLSRFDRRFWVADGSSGPGDYSRDVHREKEQDIDDVETAQDISS